MFDTSENWRQIREFPEYMISEKGEVRKINGNHLMQSHHGYKWYVNLTKDGKQYSRAIRGLLRKTFPDVGV